MKKTIFAIVAVILLNAATPERAEGQTPAQLRAQIQQKEREIERMETQFNQKTDAAQRFHAANIGTVNNATPAIERQHFTSANQQHVANEAMVRARREFTPWELANQPWLVSGRASALEWDVHEEKILNAINNKFPNKLVEGRIYVNVVGSVARNIGSKELRVFDRSAEMQRRELRSRIDEKRVAKNVIREQYRIARMTPAQRAEHNRQMGW